MGIPSMKLNEHEKEIIELLKESLVAVPNLDITLPKEEQEKYKRVKLPISILQPLFEYNLNFYQRNNHNHFDTSWIITVEELRKLDLSEVDCSNLPLSGKFIESSHGETCWLDFSYTNLVIDPQTIKDKKLSGTNLRGVDLSNCRFNGCLIAGADLRDTGAKINPQTIYEKNLSNAILSGLDLSNCRFNGCLIAGADLSYTGARINPRRLANSFYWFFEVRQDSMGWNYHKYKDLKGTNLRGNDLSRLSTSSFRNCALEGTDLRDTGIQIDFGKSKYDVERTSIEENGSSDATPIFPCDNEADAIKSIVTETIEQHTKTIGPL